MNPTLTLTPELEAAYRRDIAAREAEKAAKKPPQIKNSVAECLDFDFINFARSMAAKTPKTDEPDIFEIDGEGREWISEEALAKRHDQEALERHGNDPIKRFDEWDFPGTPRERKFLLEHDFGPLLKNSLTSLENGTWVHAYGDVSQGKTALAMRAVWEFLKSRPSRKATFIFMNQYIGDYIKRENSEQVAIRNGQEIYSDRLKFHELVIIDDFDKFNFRNEFYRLAVLNLIELLKKGKHRVFITAQISLKELYSRYEDTELRPQIDRLRQECLVLPEFKGKSNRRFKK